MYSCDYKFCSFISFHKSINDQLSHNLVIGVNFRSRHELSEPDLKYPYMPKFRDASLTGSLNKSGQSCYINSID